jgi:hypothetical protein
MAGSGLGCFSGTVPEDSLAIVAATCIYGPGPCATIGGFFGLDLVAITPNGTVTVAKGSCNCGETKQTGALTYQLALSENGGPYNVFKTLQDADWVDGMFYDQPFLRSYQSAKMRLQVFDSSGSQIGEAFASYPVDIPGKVPVSVAADGFDFEAELGLNQGGVAALRWRASEPRFVTVAIYDVGGRRLRTLFQGEAGVEWSGVEWDGRDELGREVRSGVFFARAESGGQVVTRKIVVVR